MMMRLQTKIINLAELRRDISAEHVENSDSNASLRIYANWNMTLICPVQIAIDIIRENVRILGMQMQWFRF